MEYQFNIIETIETIAIIIDIKLISLYFEVLNKLCNLQLDFQIEL